MSEQDVFFLLGAAKAGTTTLHHLLKQHPSICMSRPKEPQFFERDEEWDRGKEFYFKNYFPHCDSESIDWYGDARQRNLYLPWVPNRIHQAFPETKLLVIVRDPVQRAFSHYWHNRRHGREELEPLEAMKRDEQRIQSGKTMDSTEEKKRYQESIRENRGLYRTYLDSGYYAQQLKRYEHFFDRDQIKVLIFERFVRSPVESTRSVFQYLDVKPDVTLETAQKNKGYVPRIQLVQRFIHNLGATVLSRLVPDVLKRRIKSMVSENRDYEELHPDTARWLYKHFESHNEKLYDWLGSSVEAWEASRQSLTGQGDTG
ncbi:MAG: sulfotransferase [bacterium]